VQGGMGDLLGSKRLFTLGLLVFGIATTGCGLHGMLSALLAFGYAGNWSG